MRPITARRKQSGTQADLPHPSLVVPREGPAFSQELRNLAVQFGDRPTTLAELMQATRGRGFDLLLIFISLPFVTPIPLPGLSAPFGLVVALVGGRIAMGRQPWLPERLLARKLPPRFFSLTLKAASRIVRLLELCLRPRLATLHSSPLFRRVAGSLILLSGLLLVLPVPLPFCNSLPALTVVLLASGSLARDGGAFLAGCFVFLVTATYFTVLSLGGAHAFDKLKDALLSA